MLTVSALPDRLDRPRQRRGFRRVPCFSPFLALCAVSLLQAAPGGASPPVPAGQMDRAAALADRSLFTDALTGYRAVLAGAARHPALAAGALNGIAEAELFLGRYAAAQNTLRQAALVERRGTDARLQGKTRALSGLLALDTGQYAQAAGLLRQALAAQRGAKDLAGTGATLATLGDVQNSLEQYDQARTFSAQALEIARRLRKEKLEVSALCVEGETEIFLNQARKAVTTLQQARTIAARIRDGQGQARALARQADAENLLGRYDQAIVHCEQGVSITRRIKTPAIEGQLQQTLGDSDFYQGKYRSAIRRYQASLRIARTIHDPQMSGDAYLSLANAYNALSDFGRAVGLFKQSLAAAQRLHTTDNVGAVLGDLAGAYLALGQYALAIHSYEQAIRILGQTHDEDGQAKFLSGLGRAYRYQGRYRDALATYEKAAVMARRLGDDVALGATLANMGEADWLLKDYGRADVAFQQALAISRKTHDLETQQWALVNWGNVDMDRGQRPRAVALYLQALDVARQTGVLRAAGYCFSRLMLAYDAEASPRVAILYGKRAVNTYQQIRRGLRGLDPVAQKSFLTSKEATYRRLAELLIAQGRLPEAQQILHLLKEREFYDFLNPRADEAPPPMDSPLMTRREARWTAADDGAVRAVTALERQHAAPARIAAAREALNAVQTQTVKAFTRAAAEDASPETAAATALQRALSPGTVAVYTIVAPDTLHLILVSRAGWKAYASPITADALYQKVYAFREALTDPRLDPRPLAAELYGIVLGPLQADLDAAGAQTILFSLDDALRYVPPATFFNPRTGRYVVETYRTELITLTGGLRPSRPDRPLSILGLGVSEARDGAPPLPGVATELSTLIHEPHDAGGLLPGRRLLDTQFTQSSLETSLRDGGFPLVHLASHFSLHATRDASYLLLGDGAHLSVTEMARDPHRFRGVELLTLSACDTAMEVKSSSGREVEGVGALAQTLGARAVLASLWPVSDAATPALMAALYGYEKDHPGAPFGEALRQAQLSLLSGEAPVSTESRVKRAGRALEEDETPSGLPRFVSDPGVPFAHPYYWAPFILIGSWR